MTSCPRLGVVPLLPLLRNSPNLRVLSVMLNPQGAFNDEGMGQCCKVLKRIRSLYLGGSSKLAKHTFFSLARTCLYLRHLGANHLPLLTDECIRPVWQMEHLEEITVCGCSELTSLGLVEGIRMAQTSLRKVDVSYVPAMTEDHVESLRLVLPMCTVVQHGQTFVHPDHNPTFRVQNAPQQKTVAGKKKKK